MKKILAIIGVLIVFIGVTALVQRHQDNLIRKSLWSQKNIGSEVLMSSKTSENFSPIRPSIRNNHPDALRPKIQENKKRVVVTSVVPGNIPPEFCTTAVTNYYLAWGAALADTNAFPSMEPIIIPSDLPSEQIEKFMEAMEIHAMDRLSLLEKGNETRKALNVATENLRKELGTENFDYFVRWKNANPALARQ